MGVTQVPKEVEKVEAHLFGMFRGNKHWMQHDANLQWVCFYLSHPFTTSKFCREDTQILLKTLVMAHQAA